MKKITPFIFNILLFSSFAFIFPFIVLYYRQLGFSSTQISLLAGIVPLITLVCAPFWTNLADSTRRHKLVMNLSLIVAALTLFVIPFLQSFGLVVLVIAVNNIFNAPVTAFADSAAMNMLADEKEFYGRIRLGGTLGWGVTVLIAGWAIQTYGLSIGFWGAAGMLLLALFVSQRFTYGGSEVKESVKGDVRALLRNRRWMFFLAIAFIAGLACASSADYFAAYMQEAGAGESIIGLAIMISTISEIPILFYGDRLIKYFKPYRLLMLAMFFTGLRLLLFGLTTVPSIVMVVQLLNGLAFPAMWIAGVAYADENAPENLKSTAQGLFSAMVFGFGAAVGGFLGGILLGSLGGRGMYLVIGIVVFVSIAIITLIDKLIPTYHAKTI